jgi:subtilase family serine protease
MTFDKLASGTGIVSISVDAAQAIKESSEANNGVSRQIVVQ